MTPEIEKRIKAVKAGRLPAAHCLDGKKTQWNHLLISDLFDEVCEKNHPDADVLTIIQGTGTVLREESGREIIYDENSLASYKFVKKDDFIIHLRSFEGGLEVANQDGIVSPAYIILRPKIDVSTVYLYALFHSNQFINQTMAPAVEGARDGRSVKYEVLKKQKIFLPPLAEQKKIAEILSAQDKIIELKEKLIAEKQHQKKYLNQFLFGEKNQRITINNTLINKKKWIRKKFNEVFEFHSTNTYSRECMSHSEGNIKNIHYGDILVKYGEVLDVNKTNIPYLSSNLNLSKMFFLQSGDIVIADTAEDETAGKAIEIINTEKELVVAGLHTMFCRPQKDLFFIGWLGYYINSDEYHKQLIPLLTGTKVSSIAKKDIINTEILIPSLPEQQAIAAVLSSADEEISLLQRDLKQEKLKKKSLMQLLLTGLVRV